MTGPLPGVGSEAEGADGPPQQGVAPGTLCPEGDSHRRAGAAAATGTPVATFGRGSEVPPACGQQAPATAATKTRTTIMHRMLAAGTVRGFSAASVLSPRPECAPPRPQRVTSLRRSGGSDAAPLPEARIRAAVRRCVGLVSEPGRGACHVHPEVGPPVHPPTRPPRRRLARGGSETSAQRCFAARRSSSRPRAAGRLPCACTGCTLVALLAPCPHSSTSHTASNSALCRRREALTCKLLSSRAALVRRPCVRRPGEASASARRACALVTRQTTTPLP